MQTRDILIDKIKYKKVKYQVFKKYNTNIEDALIFKRIYLQ